MLLLFVFIFTKRTFFSLAVLWLCVTEVRFNYNSCFMYVYWTDDDDVSMSSLILQKKNIPLLTMIQIINITMDNDLIVFTWKLNQILKTNKQTKFSTEKFSIHWLITLLWRGCCLGFLFYVLCLYVPILNSNVLDNNSNKW